MGRPPGHPAIAAPATRTTVAEATTTAPRVIGRARPARLHPNLRRTRTTGRNHTTGVTSAHAQAEKPRIPAMLPARLTA